jgi:long-chain acyl-CoA synthetase
MLGTVISGDRRIGGAALEARVKKAASGFLSLGLKEGDRVAIFMRNDIAFLEATFACGELGLYPVPVNWHFSADETAYVLNDSEAKALVVHADLLPAIAKSIPDTVEVIIVETPSEVKSAYQIADEAALVPADARIWDAWLEGHAPYAGAAKAAPASMIYTSGTTGHPKGVRRLPPKEDQTAATLEARKYVFDFQPSMRAVMTGPLYHSAPNLYSTFSVRIGATLFLQPKFDAEETLAVIEREKLTHGHLVPTMFVRLLRLPDDVRAKYDLSSLVRVMHGAAPCSQAIKRQMIEWWGPVIHEYYGGTETGAAVHCSSEEWLAHPGTVGKAIPGATVKVLDDDGAELPPGEVGEIFLRLWSFPDFTYHNKEAARGECEREGLITCGDVGCLDEDGFLYLRDRKRDMVISGGVNIYPVEIEHELIQMPGVQDCAVFGIPNEEFGESLAAAIQLVDGSTLTAGAVKEWLAPRIAKYKLPHVVTFHDALPREETGKIFKRKLRDPYWKDAGRAI